FRDGTMKRVFKDATSHLLPDAILNRNDKMGFPVPLTEWIKGPAKDFFFDTFSTAKARSRVLVDNSRVLDKLIRESKFGRTVWGLFCVEVWQQEFHDKEAQFKSLLNDQAVQRESITVNQSAQ